MLKLPYQFLRALGFAFILIGICIFIFFFHQNSAAIIHWINKLGMLGPIFFLLLYCFATLFFLPTMILTLAGGVLFGPVWGTLFNLLGATLGAGCAFFFSRYFFSGLFDLEKNPRLMNLFAGVERRGWQFVALLRIVPIIPFNLVNYGLGLTKIKFSHYIATTFIFLIPTEIVSTYCGYAGMDFFIHSNLFFKQTSLLVIPALFVLYLLIKKYKFKL